MDPTTCYQDILDAIRTHDYSEALHYAQILKAWLNARGFYPENHAPERVDSVLDRLLKPACLPGALQTPFQSITCYICDAGQHISSVKQAVDEGWIEVVGDEDRRVTSHLGTCPLCRMREDQELLA